ncbi:inositol-trisphosphate 3-kinase B-like isoform X2 [Pseudophryne corroboree]|uniref:inositol-trisphosphate 3-kinase B-like isoform X2 n=1 Tax=Pseudophryne corroboree TaxID=495146 RepID=UPI003081280A
MEQEKKVPLEKGLQKLSLLPRETEKDTQKFDGDCKRRQKIQKDRENRESTGKDSPVELLPEEERQKKLVRQSDRSISSTSTCSSIAYSSPESDQVFSEEEEVQTKRKTLRKTKSWKTFFTMVHWSLRRQNSWVQLAGHEGNFKASERGHILKKYSPVENACLEALMEDVLRPYVPTYYGLVERDEQTYIKMEDLLMGLEGPSIMDCKIGIRTYLEEELAKALQKPTPRKDMYNKMIALDPQAPTPEEHMQKAVTKPRYMQWRESLSSTELLGFRIEGVTVEAGPVKKNFKKMKSRENIMETFVIFTKSRKDILVIGSSLLFVHDRRGFSNVWMIDFGKTSPAPSHITLRHDVPWEPGTHEDGYLMGLKNLIDTIRDIMCMLDERREEAGDSSVLEDENMAKEKTLPKKESEGNATNGEKNDL